MPKSNEALLADLTDEELARLPARLRRLTVDEHTRAWNEAKRVRDEAIAAATEEVTEDLVDVLGNPYVQVTTRITDPEAVAAATQRWNARKAELLAQAED